MSRRERRYPYKWSSDVGPAVERGVYRLRSVRYIGRQGRDVVVGPYLRISSSRTPVLLLHGSLKLGCHTVLVVVSLLSFLAPPRRRAGFSPLSARLTSFRRLRGPPLERLGPSLLVLSLRDRLKPPFGIHEATITYTAVPRRSGSHVERATKSFSFGLPARARLA